MRKTVILSVLCIVGAFLNVAINVLINRAAGLPLYLDTILTVSLTLTGGLFWGLITGFLTNIIGPTLYFYGWEGYLFVICNMATALVTWLFIRFFPRELSFEQTEIPQASQKPSSRRFAEAINTMIVLILLSFSLCLVISILGGVIATFIQSINPAVSGMHGLSADLTATMFGKNIPIVLAEILSRIPVNIIDRLITAFAGFGIALFCKNITRRR